MRTCGGCYHFRFGRCKNKRAATYGERYPANSEACQMHLTNLLLPFGCILAIIGPFIAILSIIMTGGSGGTSSNGSSSGGFEI